MENITSSNHSTRPDADLHLEGVFEAQKKDGTRYYRSSVTYHNKHISLGSYLDPHEAHRAYCDACRLVGRHADAGNDPSEPLSVSDYDPGVHTLSFEKWVVLCNFRDNGIYIPTPIYIRPSFLIYYFTPEDFFLFSTEDLFYYSAHRIQRRGGHFFVSEYGMQVNILNRYGIRNYAVCGKDYRFRNGNAGDYRYENIEILNTYHGLTLLHTAEGLRYLVQIHVKGYKKVGVYDSPLLAAIAYNKAADELNRRGIKRHYPVNFIESVSPSKYAELYASIEIFSEERTKKDHLAE